MEALPTGAERQHLVSSFLEIAVGQTADIATQFLEATSWKLDEAVQLFNVSNDGGGAASASLPSQNSKSLSEREKTLASDSFVQGALEDEVRPPLPVKRDTLYGESSIYRFQPSPVVAFRNFDEESKRAAVWNSEETAASTANDSRDNLASLYRPPFALMFQGSFDQAKVEASHQGKWLLINLQSNEEFSSHMLNRDTWANEAVAQTIRTNFVFWQMYHDTSEGKKVCTYYSLITLPAVLVIDPITGQKMRAWNGMVHPERMLEDLLPFLDKGPKEHHTYLPHKRPRVAHDSTPTDVLDKEPEEDDLEVMQAIAASLENAKDPVLKSLVANDEPKTVEVDDTNSNGKPSYPVLPDEPKGSRELFRVGIRLPDGRRIQRNFRRTDVELVNYYLKRKIHGLEIERDIIPEVDLYKCEPWELAEKLFLPRDPEWYFFRPRVRKYPNRFCTNRATKAGYWKSTGKDRRVCHQNRAIGMKKTLVYYRGRAPRGIRTDWVMHEYRLDDKECDDTLMGLQDSYALCRVFKKNVMCTEVEEQGQCSLAMVEIRSQVVSGGAEFETASPGDMPVGSSSCIDEDDKDDAWMQFITDDAWCSNITSSECGEQEPSNTVALVN